MATTTTTISTNNHHVATSSSVFVGFSSGSRAPLRQLSNLADAPFTLTWPADLYGVPPHMRGTTACYDTAEHAYQALLSLDGATAREFETGGLVSMNVFRAFPVCKGKRHTIVDLYDRKARYWGIQKGCCGIAPKMVANLPRDVALGALGLRLAPRHVPMMMDTYEQQRALWRPIHSAKFAQNAAIAATWRSTAPARLVEAGRFRQSGQYWSAFIDGPRLLIGHNVMGRILTDLRDDEGGSSASASA